MRLRDCFYTACYTHNVPNFIGSKDRNDKTEKIEKPEKFSPYN